MIAKWVLNSLTVDGKRELMLDEDSFTFLYAGSSRKERDGPSMLKIIFDRVNPNTTVGVMKHKKFLQTAHVGDHDACVTKLLDNMALNYKKILERKRTHNDYLMHLFDALETVRNTKFHLFIENERRAFETNRCSKNYGPKDLIRAAREVYNNLIDQDMYDSSKETKKRTKKEGEKPEASRLLAFLTTAIQGTKKKGGQWSEIEDWRFEKTQDTISKNGKTWWWCDKHKGRNQEVTGMYVRHPQEDHDE